MTVELGHLALILAFLVAVVQMVVPMVGAARGCSAPNLRARLHKWHFPASDISV